MIYERLHNFIVPLVLYVYVKKKLTLIVKLYNFSLGYLPYVNVWDVQASCYGFNSSKFLMLKLCSPNNNTLQKSGILVVNDILGTGSCGIKGVARHLILNHLVVDPVLILILVILSHIPSL